MNAQNAHGNTCLQLACLRPHAEALCPHLLRIGEKILNGCCFDVGPPSQTVGQRQNNIGSHVEVLPDLMPKHYVSSSTQS